MSDLVAGYKPAILCVDGDSASLQAHQALLAGQYELTLAATARDTLREVNRRCFDAFVLEYWIDGWTGPSVCRDIRQTDPHVPIICCSASQMDRDKARMLRAGANEYLPKPAGQDLARLVRALVAEAASNIPGARVAAEHAARADFERRLERRREGLATAFHGVERTARNRALEAFLKHRGTRAHFERSWPAILRGAEETVSTRAFAPRAGTSTRTDESSGATA